MSIVTVVIFAAGATLLYAGIKDVDPRDVIKDSIKGKDSPGKAPETKPQSHIKKPPGADNGTANV